MARSLIISALSFQLAACALVPPTHLGGIAASVEPMDYARRLCTHLPLDAYPTCVSAVLDEFDRPQPTTPPLGYSTSGPFAVIMQGEMYLGDYRSSIFVADFSVSNGHQTCRGAYNAFRGSVDARYDVYCSDGRAGWADLIHDTDGRRGIGKLMLVDGTEGEIVFGHVPLAAFMSNRS